MVVAGRLISDRTIDGTTLRPLGARESLVVLWLDATTGALLDHYVVGDAAFFVEDVAVRADGTVHVVGSTDTPFATCPGGLAPPPAGDFDAFVLTLRP